MKGLAELSPSYLLQRYEGILSVASAGPALLRRHSMKPNLKQLFQDVPVLSWQGDSQRSVDSLMADSRRVVPGTLFFALPGLRTNGSLYLEEAIDRGAVAVVSEDPPGPHTRVTYVQVKDARAAMAQISKRFFGQPDESLRTIGITGTNGKTTVSWLVQYLLRSHDHPVGLLGTIHYDLGRRTLPSFRTTPESLDVYALLQRMQREGCERAVMEVSSHALSQKRVQYVSFRTAAFLNLTQDHLDYHGTMEDYFVSKVKLFDGSTGSIPENAVINLDDPYGRELLRRLPGDVRPFTFGVHSEAMFRISDLQLSPRGTVFKLNWPGGQSAVFTRLPGRYNASNIVAALSIAAAEGYDVLPLINRLADFSGVPGRMERVDGSRDFNVFVDYAHTDDALRNALSMLREITPGRLLVVFGCGGDRDRAKRVPMTQAVVELADLVWATADNPRSESLRQIFSDMAPAMGNKPQFRFEDDRRQAISQAIAAALPGDCVLIAGKGHEAFQEFADTVIPFDDRVVARDLLRNKTQPSV